MAKKTNRRRKTSAAKRSGARRGGMAHWYVLGAAIIGGVLYMDNWTPGPETAATAIRTASIERKARTGERQTALARPMPKPAERVEPKIAVEEKLPAFSGKWFICTTQTDYCVLDAPAIADARCDAERSRGGDAKLRLREILSEGDVTLVAAKGATGKAGAAPHVVMRSGQSVGQRLVREGLARPWTGRHQSWCG